MWCVRFVAVAVLSAWPAFADDKPQTVLVVPLHNGPGVEQNVADLITETLSADIQKATGRRILTQKDVSAMLGLERQKMLMGCAENSSCLTEIAGALNAPNVVHGTIGHLGETWVLNLALIDARTGNVVERYSSRSEAASAAVFLDESPAAVRHLFSLDGGASGSVSSSGRHGVHWVFATLRGNVGLPPQNVASTTFFGSVLAGVQLTPAWSVAAGGLIVRGGGAVVRGAFVPFNVLGVFKPVIGLEVPVVFGASVSVGVAVAPGFQADVTSWLSFGLDVPVTWFPTAPAGVPSLYVFGAATATVRFL